MGPGPDFTRFYDLNHILYNPREKDSISRDMKKIV